MTKKNVIKETNKNRFFRIQEIKVYNWNVRSRTQRNSLVLVPV